MFQIDAIYGPNVPATVALHVVHPLVIGEMIGSNLGPTLMIKVITKDFKTMPPVIIITWKPNQWQATAPLASTGSAIEEREWWWKIEIQP